MLNSARRWSSLRQSFLTGLLSLLPLYITGRILLFLFEMVDGPLGARINAVIQDVTGTEIHVPGLGLIGTLLIVLGVGWLARIVLFRRVLEMVEELIAQVPLVSSLYSASRQIMLPFTDQSKLPFSQVILAEYPMQGRYTVGLVAKERASDDPEDPRMVVFFPTNHLHLGYPVVLLREDVQRLDMTIEEAIKFFVSCGVVGNDNLLRWQGRAIPAFHHIKTESIA